MTSDDDDKVVPFAPKAPAAAAVKQGPPLTPTEQHRFMCDLLDRTLAGVVALAEIRMVDAQIHSKLTADVARLSEAVQLLPQALTHLMTIRQEVLTRLPPQPEPSP